MVLTTRRRCKVLKATHLNVTLPLLYVKGAGGV